MRMDAMLQCLAQPSYYWRRTGRTWFWRLQPSDSQSLEAMWQPLNERLPQHKRWVEVYWIESSATLREHSLRSPGLMEKDSVVRLAMHQVDWVKIGRPEAITTAHVWGIGAWSLRLLD